jgi:hypothetical protein
VTSERRSIESTVIHVTLFAIVAALILGMLANAFDAYFILGGTVTISPAEILRFRLLAATALALPVGGAIFAFVRGRWIFGILHLLAIIAVVGSAVVFAVPRDALTPPPPLPRQHSTYTPCYSGSGTCAGG